MDTEKDILDFIVIGAQKAGTTSLFQYLRQHPDISLPVGKEAPYFSHDSAYERGWATYMRNLREHDFKASADPLRKWGTVTPQYMVGGVYEVSGDVAVRHGYDERTVPLRIYERLPDVRLIAILRDPVERAFSHHKMATMRGGEKRSFDDVIDELLRPDALDGARRRPEEQTGYVTWGEYGRILAGYLDVFPRVQMLVVFTDELERDPAALLRRIQEFIGVSAEFSPDNLGARFHVGAAARRFSLMSPSSWMSPASPVSPQGFQRALRHSAVIRAVWHALPQARRRRLRRPYERIAIRVAVRRRRGGADNGGTSPSANPATLARLREHYAEDTARLAALFGVSPPWLTSDEREMTRR